MKLLRKTIVVTGCTKGIGRAVCELFASSGYNVAGCARNEDEINELNNFLAKKFKDQHFVFAVVDVNQREAMKNFAALCVNSFESLDILVNNAGIFLPGTIRDEADGLLEKLLSTNLISAYHFTRDLLPVFIEQGSGHIFNLCSIASLRAYPNGGSYTISKFAMMGFTSQLREELRNDHIKVTAVIPGATLTDSWKGTDLPGDRFMEAGDIAKMILSASQLSATANVDEILIRPTRGDI